MNPKPNSMLYYVLLLIAIIFVQGIARSLHAQVPPAERPKSVDRFGDRLPEGASVRLGTIRLRHGGSCSSISISPDGTRIASGGSGGVRLWDVSTGGEVLRFAEKAIPINSLSLRRTGRLWPRVTTLALSACGTPARELNSSP